MRAAVTHRRSEISLETLDDPQPQGGNAVIQVSAVGIYGTDLHIWDGHRPDVPFSVRQGHEIGGTMAALPSGYAGELEIGDVVAVDPSMPCGQCRPCVRGHWSNCA